MKTKIQILILSKILQIILKIIFMTCKWKIHNMSILKNAIDQNQPILICCWHNRFLYSAHFFKKYKINIWAISSTHRDSEIMAKILRGWGLQLIRGSSTRGWRNVLKKMMELFNKKETIIALTNDGPQGPALIAKKGSVMVAHKKNAQIISMSGISTKFWQLKSWDKTRIPKPFSTIHIQFGNPFQGFKNSDNEVQEITEYINENYNNLDSHYKS